MIGKLRGLGEHLRAHIRGQEHVIAPVCDVLLRGQMQLSSPQRPRGVFLFCGPTGVGKTELARCFTDYLFAPGHLHRFDMSEFMHLDSVKEFRGDASGGTGRLGAALRLTTCGTLLFDEMEKAHRQILDLFLQMLDAGRITLGDGRVYDLSAFYIVFTSNIGAERIMHNTRLKFATVRRIVLAKVAQALRPEFVARIPDKLVFNKLDIEVQKDIARLLLTNELERLAGLGHRLQYTPEALRQLTRQGIDRLHGARPMRSVIERQVQGAVAAQLLKQAPTSGTLTYGSQGFQVVAG